MQRMTIRTPTGAALEMADAYQSEDAARSDLMKRFRLAIDRLAAYEDTGLSVSDVAALAGGGIRYTSDYRCPSCGGTFTGTGIADYCYHCGQRLDWKNH